MEDQIESYLKLHEQRSLVFSPSAFISDPKCDNLDVFHLNHPEAQILLDLEQSPPESSSKNNLEIRTKDSERELKRKLAGLKSREKKKKYIESMEENVKKINEEIELYESEIRKEKSKLVEAINYTKNQSNQHAYTFTELDQTISSEDPDLDKINMLLNMLKTRIGANGKQRQAKMDYYFLQIFNGLFPALHRYLLYTAQKQKDIFAEFQCEDFSKELFNSQKQENKDKNKFIQWTRQLFGSMKLTNEQIHKIRSKIDEILGHKKDALRRVKKLKGIKNEIKMKQQIFENEMDNLRWDMTPVQSAKLTLFGEKHKYRKQFNMDKPFDPFTEYETQIRLQIENRMEENEPPMHKKIKLQSNFTTGSLYN